MQTAEQNHVYMTFCPISKNCQLENELISTDYTSLVGEKLFSDVQKNTILRSKFIVAGFAGPAHSPYFAALNLHVGVSWNSTELHMPRERTAKL